MKTNTKTNVAKNYTHEGAVASNINPEQELRRTVMACLLHEDNFYEEGESVASRIKALMPKVRKDKLFELIVEAKGDMYLRHTPLFMAREFARMYKGSEVSELICTVIQRADELAEFLAMYWTETVETPAANPFPWMGGNATKIEKKLVKTPLSKQVKLGLSYACGKFNEYQFAKYNRKNAVKLRDVFRLVHPKPENKEQAELWGRIISNTLATPNTWENRLSSGEDKKAVFTDLLLTNSLGALALLRNLRNMRDAGVSETLIREKILACNFFKVLPFRFVAAAQYVPQYEDVLEQAMFKSLADFNKLPGKTAIVIDNSGSMSAPLSGKSEMTRSDAACALAMMVREICDHCTVISFGTYAVEIPNRRGFALRDAIKSAHTEHGTDTDRAVKLANKSGYDRIIVITDEQSATQIGPPKGKGYMVNVASYQNGIGYGPWTHIDGFSEQILRYVQAAEGLDSDEGLDADLG